MPTPKRIAKRTQIKSQQKINQERLSTDIKLKIEKIERANAKARKPITTIYKLHDNIKELISEINFQLTFKALHSSNRLNQKLFEALEIADIVHSYKDPLVYKYLDSAEKAGLRIMEEDYNKLFKLIKEVHKKTQK